MAKFKCLKPCKINGKWTKEKDVIELTDKAMIKHFKANDAIVETNEARALTPSEELQKVKPVTQEIAEQLLEVGITTVDKLSAYSVKQLVEEVKLDVKIAEKIFKSFE